MEYNCFVRCQVLPKWHSGKESACQYRKQEMWIWSLGGEDSLEKEVAIHSRILAWKIPRTEEPGGLQSMRLQGVWHYWVTEGTHTFTIALQCCVSFCWTATWISCIYTYIPSLLSLPPTPTPNPNPLGHHRASSWTCCAIQQLPTSDLFYSR